MKGILGLLLPVFTLSVIVSAHAQNVLRTEPTNRPPPDLAPSSAHLVQIGPARVVERGQNQRIWERPKFVTNIVGGIAEVKVYTNRYTELGAGICYQQPDGKWVDSQPRFVLALDGSVEATELPHKIRISPDLHSIGAVKMTLPNKATMSSTFRGLYLYDSSTQKRLLVSDITHSIGTLISSNVVVYSNCFARLKGDLVLKVSPVGIAQDVVIRESLSWIPFDEIGFDARSTVLEAWTEFYDAPAPEKATRTLPGRIVAEEPLEELADETLRFGEVLMVPGRAYLTGETNASIRLNAPGIRRDSVPVGKRWHEQDGRHFLIERVRWREILPQFKRLETNSVETALVPARASRLHSLPVGRPPPKLLASSTKATILMAQAPATEDPAFILDYTIVSCSGGVCDGYRFAPNETYYISSPIMIQNEAVFCGGTVIKLAAWLPGASITISGTARFETGPGRMVIITGKDDNSVGELIEGSSGTPEGVAYGYPALSFAYESAAVTIDYLRVSWSPQAIFFDNSGKANRIRHSQIVDGWSGVFCLGNELTAHNVLFGNVDTPFEGYFYTAYGQHVTVNRAWELAYDYSGEGSSLTLVNSIVFDAAPCSTMSCTLPAPSVWLPWSPPEEDPFQTSVFGAHYLADNSIYRGAGISAIDEDLKRALKEKTTWPPVPVSGAYNPLTLDAKVPRNAGANPDLGFSYDAVDYVVGGLYMLSGSAALTIQNGVTVGVNAAGGGIWLAPDVNLISEGSPLGMNRFVELRSVQEQYGGATGFSFIRHAGGPHEIRLRFTQLIGRAGMDWHIYREGGEGDTVLQNCQLLCGGLGGDFQSLVSHKVELFNNLFESSKIIISAAGGTQVDYRNNTFKDGEIWLTGLNISSGVRDSLFDTVTLASSPPVTATGNGYYQTTWPLSGSPPNHTLISPVGYQKGPLGNFYLPSGSSPLLSGGSRTPAAAGLFHYTTQVNQQKEGSKSPNLKVDVGFHYVALNSSKLPIDTDSDGQIDITEDRNSNGKRDAGETSWKHINLAFASAPMRYLLGEPAKSLDSLADVHDDAYHLGGGQLTAEFVPTSESGDVLGIMSRASGPIKTQSGNILHGSQMIGTFSGGSSGSPLIITFNSDSDLEKVRDLLRNLAFHSTSVKPAMHDRTVRLGITDGQGEASGDVYKVVTVQCPTRIDLMMVMDVSYSLAGDPFIDEKKAATNFVRFLNFTSGADSDRVGIIKFCGYFPDQGYTAPVTVCPLMADRNALETGIHELVHCWGTQFHQPLGLARLALPSSSSDRVLRAIVLMTDGDVYPGPESDNHEEYRQKARDEAEIARKEGIRVLTVAFGQAPYLTEVGKNLLRDIATTPEDFYDAQTSSQLKPTLYTVAQNLCRARNSPPFVNAGPDASVSFGMPYNLNGATNDPDGLLQTPLSVHWRQVSGPGEMNFVEPANPVSPVSFSLPGKYILKLNADDGQYVRSDEVEITVCQRQERPTDYVLIIDVSGSMWGEPLEIAKAAAKKFIARVNLNGPNPDRLGVVPFITATFGSHALSSDAEALSSMIDKIEYECKYDLCEYGGGTIVAPALLHAKSYLERGLAARDSNPVLVILSDFFDTSDPELNLPPELLAAALEVRKMGARIICGGVMTTIQGRELQRDLMEAIATPGDVHEIYSNPQIDEFFMRLADTPPCAATLENPVVFGGFDQVLDSPGAVTLSGKVFDTSILLPGLNLQRYWEAVSGPATPTLMVQSENPFVVSANFPAPGNYVVRLVGKKLLPGTELRSEDSVCVHVGDAAVPIYPENGTPWPEADYFEVEEDSGEIVLDVLSNDTDPEGNDTDPQGETWHISNIASTDLNGPERITVPTDLGTVIVDNNRTRVQYLPHPNKFGNIRPFCFAGCHRARDEIPYYVSDGHSSRWGYIFIYIKPKNDPPTANKDIFVVPPAPRSLDVLANDYPDLDGEPMNSGGHYPYRITAVSLPVPPRATVQIEEGNEGILLTPSPLQPPEEEYQVSFTYTVSDKDGALATAMVEVKVTDNACSQPPIAVDDQAFFYSRTDPQISHSLWPLENDTEPCSGELDHDGFVITSVVRIAPEQDQGSEMIANSSYLTYKPALGFAGREIYRYTFRNNWMPETPEVSANIYISVGVPSNFELRAVDDEDSILQSQSSGKLIHVLANDQLPLNEVVKIVSLSPVSQGTAAVEISGSIEKIRFTPDPNPAVYGPATLIYTLQDLMGNRSAATLTVHVTRVANQNPVAILDPLVRTGDLQYPEDPDVPASARDPIKVVRQGHLTVSGTATDPDLLDFFYYDLLVYNLDGVLVASGRGTQRVVNGSLGPVDLTLLPNGVYELALFVKGGVQETSSATTERFILDTGLKLGHFDFSEEDATLQIGGLPLTITRSYSSMTAAANRLGDFGYGWTYSLSDLEMDIDEIRKDVADVADPESSLFSLRVGGGRNVTLTLPGGERTTFYFSPEMVSFGIKAAWKAAPGITAKLRSEQEEILNGLTLKWLRNQDVSFEKYDIPAFVLTMLDGTAFHIEREDLKEHYFSEGSLGDKSVHAYGKGKVKRIVTREGEWLEFVDSGVVHYAKSGTSTLALTIEPDPQSGLIKAIYDPAGLSGSGGALPVVSYDYDEHTNLVKVAALINRDPLNPVYRTTTYKYEDPQRRHFITSVDDPRGVRITKNTYDEKGRIQKVQRPDGRSSEFRYDLESQQGGIGRQEVVGINGRVYAQEYDTNGNVIYNATPVFVWATGEVPLETWRVFDTTYDPQNGKLGNNRLLEETNHSAGHLTITKADYDPASPLQTVPTSIRGPYPASGEPDPEKVRVTISKYNEFGELLEGVSPRFAGLPVTQRPYQKNEFNSDGELTKTISYVRKENQPQEIEAITVIENQFNPTTKFLDVSIDALGTRTEHTYYSGDSNDPGGAAGQLKSTLVRALNPATSQWETLQNTTFTYDENGNLATKTEKRTQIDENGATLPEIAEVTEYVYDAQNRIIETFEPRLAATPRGLSSKTSYDSSGRVASTTDRFGKITRFWYNALGERTKVEYPDGSFFRSTTVQYDTAGSPTARIVYTEDPHFEGEPAFGTRTTYDAAGRVAATHRDLLNIIEARNGEMIETELSEGGSSVGEIANNQYYADGSLYNTKDAANFETTFDYDEGYGLFKSTSRAGLIKIDSIYDLNGNLKKTVNSGLGIEVSSTERVYDDLDRLSEMRWPAEEGGAQPVEHSKYDALGRLVLKIDRDQIKTGYAYDGRGRLIAVTNAYDTASATITHYRYDQAGNLLEIVDARLNATRFAYDALGRRLWRRLPGGQKESWQYDLVENGTLVNKQIHTDFRGYPTRLEHDSRGRLVAKIPLAVPNDTRTPDLMEPVTFIHTATGKPKRITQGTQQTGIRETKYAHDGFDRLRVKTSPEGHLTYEYLPNGKLMRLRSNLTYSFDQDGNIIVDNPAPRQEGEEVVGIDVLYNWTYAGQLLSVNADSPEVNLGQDQNIYEYEGHRVKSVLYKNQVKTTFAYNKSDQLRSVNVVREGSPPTALATFDYDDSNDPAERRLSPSGRRNALHETIQGLAPRIVHYDYDLHTRLTRETINPDSGQQVISYQPQAGQESTTGYDAVGNRRSRKLTNMGAAPVSDDTDLRYDANDRLTGEGAATDYAYDANGNTLAANIGNGITADDIHDEYDYENRLIRRKIGDVDTPSKVIQFRYDADGSRVSKSVAQAGNTTTIAYLVDDLNPTGYAQILEELVSLNSQLATLNRKYLYGLRLIRQEINDGATWTKHYYAHDGHGSVRYLTDVDGAISDRYTYDAFGILISPSAYPENNKYLYAGEQYDKDLGLYYLRDRVMSPELGRFWTGDRFEGRLEDPLSVHKYLYARADPINNVDPSGLTDLASTTVTATGMARLGMTMNTVVANVTARLMFQLTRAALFSDKALVFLEAGAAAVAGGTVIANSAIQLTAQAFEVVADMTDRVVTSYANNTRSIPQGWAARGIALEQLGAEHLGEAYVGGNVEKIDVFETRGAKVAASFKSHALDPSVGNLEERYRNVLIKDALQLSQIDVKDISGTKTPLKGGGQFFLPAGSAEIKIVYAAIPENHAKVLLKPSFSQGLREAAQTMRNTIIVPIPVRNFRK